MNYKNGKKGLIESLNFNIFSFKYLSGWNNPQANGLKNFISEFISNEFNFKNIYTKPFEDILPILTKAEIDPLVIFLLSSTPLNALSIFSKRAGVETEMICDIEYMFALLLDVYAPAIENQDIFDYNRRSAPDNAYMQKWFLYILYCYDISTFSGIDAGRISNTVRSFLKMLINKNSYALNMTRVNCMQCSQYVDMFENIHPHRVSCMPLQISLPTKSNTDLTVGRETLDGIFFFTNILDCANTKTCSFYVLNKTATDVNFTINSLGSRSNLGQNCNLLSRFISQIVISANNIGAGGQTCSVNCGSNMGSKTVTFKILKCKCTERQNVVKPKLYVIKPVHSILNTEILKICRIFTLNVKDLYVNNISYANSKNIKNQVFDVGSKKSTYSYELCNLIIPNKSFDSELLYIYNSLLLYHGIPLFIKEDIERTPHGGINLTKVHTLMFLLGMSEAGYASIFKPFKENGVKYKYDTNYLRLFGMCVNGTSVVNMNMPCTPNLENIKMPVTPPVFNYVSSNIMISNSISYIKSIGQAEYGSISSIDISMTNLVGMTFDVLFNIKQLTLRTPQKTGSGNFITVYQLECLVNIKKIRWFRDKSDVTMLQMELASRESNTPVTRITSQTGITFETKAVDTTVVNLIEEPGSLKNTRYFDQSKMESFKRLWIIFYINTPAPSISGITAELHIRDSFSNEITILSNFGTNILK